MKRLLTPWRVFDVAAILAVLFLLYRIFVAPRFLSPSTALPAPHVTYSTLAGKPFILTEHRGRVVFLDFWASWCVPCKAALPLVERFARVSRKLLRKRMPLRTGFPTSP
jgi:thiol-disulfide isomerase/thioredoxin